MHDDAYARVPPVDRVEDEVHVVAQVRDGLDDAHRAAQGMVRRAVGKGWQEGCTCTCMHTLMPTVTSERSRCSAASLTCVHVPSTAADAHAMHMPSTSEDAHAMHMPSTSEDGHAIARAIHI